MLYKVKCHTDGKFEGRDLYRTTRWLHPTWAETPCLQATKVRIWFETVTQMLEHGTHGIDPGTADPCIYIKASGTVVIVAV